MMIEDTMSWEIKVPGDLFHNFPTLWTVGEGNQVRTIKTLFL